MKDQSTLKRVWAPAAAALVAGTAVLLTIPQLAAAAGGGGGHDTGHAVTLLLFACINFGLFVALIIYLLRRPLGEFLTHRYEEVTHELQRVQAARTELNEELDELKSRLGQITTEAETLKTEIVDQAKREASQREADAEALAKATVAGGQERAAGLERETKLRLVNEAVTLLKDKAAGKLGASVDAAANQKLAAKLAARMEARR